MKADLVLQIVVFVVLALAFSISAHFRRRARESGEVIARLEASLGWAQHTTLSEPYQGPERRSRSIWEIRPFHVQSVLRSMRLQSLLGKRMREQELGKQHQAIDFTRQVTAGDIELTDRTS
jgi:hypothetical protein